MSNRSIKFHKDFIGNFL